MEQEAEAILFQYCSTRKTVFVSPNSGTNPSIESKMCDCLVAGHWLMADYSGTYLIGIF